MNNETKQPVYVYIVQDYEQHLVGVHSTLIRAAEQFQHILTYGLSAEDQQMLIDEFGEDYHEELDHVPTIVVHAIDGYCVWSYDSTIEIKHALQNGEQYDD